MKIKALKFAGFRGARTEVALELPGSFVVIAGRNGTGKSTICDAVEFALTGRLRQESGHTEKREGIIDYVWWRGDKPPIGRFVEATVVDEDGKLYTVRRTPTETLGHEVLEHVLCDQLAKLENPLSQLCRTTIVRDEEITRLSVDLKETDRFELVRSILGTADFSAAEAKAKKLNEILNEEIDRVEKKYALINTRITDLTAKLSTARTEVAEVQDISRAEGVLREFIGTDERNPDALATTAERGLARLRVSIDQLTRLYTRLQEWKRREAQNTNANDEHEIASLIERMAATKQAVEQTERLVVQRNKELAEAQTADPKNASLAIIREHGERLGLQNGRCPLCGALHSPDDFHAALIAIADGLARSYENVSALAKQAADEATLLMTRRSELDRLLAEVDEKTKAKEHLQAEKSSIVAELASLGITMEDDRLPQSDALAEVIETHRQTALSVENSIAILQTSRAVEEVGTLEHELMAARAQQTTCEARVSRARAAANKAREAFDTVRRARGEFVNEQLAELEPLLVELYQRLRPHVDWPEVRYKLRGDVRRMLSFEIGEGLNPSFIFSSGQRRAAGLAFLLALHLSRSWCSLKTLILDDPVQHIDDYRALHLTEVLAAIRKSGRQVICAVEDESLGKLLARRLRADSESPGMFLQMGYSSEDGVRVKSAQYVGPMAKSVLIPA